MSFIDNRRDIEISLLAITTSGALVQPITVKQIVSSTLIDIELPILTGTAVASDNIVLSGFRRPVNIQEDFIHVVDGNNLRIGQAQLTTSGVLTISSVAANGRPTTFSINQSAGWETLQLLSFALV